MADGDELHGMIVHFSCEHSYFCGKTRSYLRYKQQAKSSESLRADLDGCTATLQFQDVLVTGGPAGMRAELERLTGSPAIPQVRLEDGKTYVQDTAAIVDAVDALHPLPAINPSPSAGPRQLLASYLLELFADEWMIVWCFHTRWRANMKPLNSEGVVKPGECVPASEAGTSCCNNRDYIALQFSHLRNNVSPIHSAGTDGAGSGKVDKAARIGPTLDFFDESFNCAAATEAGGCAENAFSRNVIIFYTIALKTTN
jgi:glutathione S-transferase